MRFGLVGTDPWAEMAHGPGLVECAASGTPHELDLRFGLRVVELLAEAQDQLDRAATTSGAPA